MENSFNVLAGWLLDGTGVPARQRVLVRIENGRIASIEDLKTPEAPPDLPRLVDLSDHTVLPGLIDCHVHLAFSGTGDQEVRKRQLTYDFDQNRPLISERIMRHLSRGILALRDGGDSRGHVLRYKAESLSSPPGAPMELKSAGKAWRAEGRYGKFIGRPPESALSLAECIAREQNRSDHVKIINSGLNSLTELGKETPAQFSADALAAAVRRAREQGRKTMIHANGKHPVRLAVEAGCDSIEHGYFMGKENIERLAERRICWIPTAFSMKAFLTHLPSGSVESEVSAGNLAHQMEQIAYARQTGARIAVGTDAGGFRIRHGKAFAEELKIFRRAGFSVEETIRCATSEGARLLGIEDDFGRLKPGMPASFIAVRSSPSAVIDSLDRVERVYIRGTRMV